MNDDKREVIVTDIQMPFMSMVFFMVKWAIASIPAISILMIAGLFISTLFAALMR